MAYKDKEVKGAVILKELDSEKLQQQIFYLLHNFEIIEIQYSSASLAGRGAAVAYSALCLLGEKIEHPEEAKPAAAPAPAA